MILHLPEEESHLPVEQTAPDHPLQRVGVGITSASGYASVISARCDMTAWPGVFSHSSLPCLPPAALVPNLADASSEREVHWTWRWKITLSTGLAPLSLTGLTQTTNNSPYPESLRVK